MSMNERTNKNTMSLYLRISLIVYVLVFATCCFCAWYVLKASRRQLMEKTFESACNEQYTLGKSIKTYAESNKISINDKLNGFPDVLRNAVISYSRYYTKETVSFIITKDPGTVIYSNMSEEDRGSIHMSPSEDGTIFYCMRQVGSRTVIFVSSNVRIYEDLYRFDYAQDITDLVTNDINLAERISVLLFVSTTSLLVLLYLSLKKMLKPLWQLGIQARAMTLGNYNLRVNIIHNDEVGSLANDFNNMAEAIQNQINTLSESARLRELFAANLAHEIKTPITSIIGYSDIAARMELDPEKLYKILEYIKKEGKRIDDLSQKLLNWSQVNQEKEAEIKPCKSKRMIDHILYMLRPQLESQRQILKVYNETSIINVNETLIISLIINLCKNASKASREGQTLELYFEHDQTGGVIIKVIDHGIGIEKAELEKIREPFYMIDQARDSAQKGTGLGLSLCDAIAKAHHGEMVIESEPNAGTCVTVFLPMTMSP